jgi:acyl-phosphate glycerol 3-phosphate acyltransferase
MPSVPVIITIVAAYFAGSVPFGYLIARRYGIDIRSIGSGNIGATNVGRQLGRKLGIVVFILDFAKGAVPVAVARLLDLNDWLPVAAGLAAFLGHIFPVWLGFRGGKGVATGAGVVAVLLPIPAVAALLAWLACLSATRYVSIASVVAATVLTVTHLVSVPEPFGPAARILTAFCLLAMVLVVVRHWSNLARLYHGTEGQSPETPAMNLLGRVLHVLSLGLWFGSGIFFTFVVAVLLFATLEGFGKSPSGERPTWLPLPADFDKSAGTRLAGATIAPIFPAYFALQGICGLLSLITAYGFTRGGPTRRIHRVRFWVILLAMLTVVAGWPLEQKVSELRLLRNEGDPAARASFGAWHTASLFLNFATIGLVTAAMAMAASLPSGTRKGEK